MIVNKTVYSAEDMQFMYRDRPKKPLFNARQILSLVIDVLMICWCLYYFLRFNEFSTGIFPSWLPVLVILMFILPADSIRKSVKGAVENRKRSTDWEAMQKTVSEERTFTFGEDSAEVRIVTDDIEYIKKYSYKKLEKLYVGADRIYAVMKVNNTDVFMPVHDSGYIEGTKEELIGLLEKSGVKREDI